MSHDSHIVVIQIQFNKNGIDLSTIRNIDSKDNYNCPRKLIFN